MLDKFKEIQHFVFDVDGVLTNGSLLLDPTSGQLLRSMNTRDGYALQLAVKKGFEIIIITGGKSSMVEDRLKGLGIKEVHLGVHEKKTLLESLSNRIDLNKTLYMGDDIPDLEAMQLCGIPSAPADACSEILSVAQYVSPKNGGQGCVRDVIEKVMKLQGKW